MATQANSTFAHSSSRRGFLRGLVALPLVGGSVSLIGAPTAVAEPASRDVLRTYASWLLMEHQRVTTELYPNEPPRVRGLEINQGYWFHHNADGLGAPLPSARATLVLGAVGCDWRDQA